ncbi:MAG: hypothetical protein ACM31C_19965 [Acidobacteriota bacterium]
MKALIAVAIVLACVRLAAAEVVTVKVVEVAGGNAYVQPGRAAGLIPGTKVRFRGRELTVVESTEKTAMLETEGMQLVPGDSGSANVDRTAAATVKMLPKPRPAEAFKEQWPAPVLPAEVQTPKPVPLGEGRAPGGRAHVTVIGHGFGAVQKGRGAEGDGEARVIASFDAMSDRPLAVDLDVAGRAFSSGYDKATHTPVYVRAAQLRYGDQYDPSFALGRLRFAASSVGMLDGGRAAAHFGTLELAAFGGLVPDPVSGKPSTDASRFGAELVYDANATPWQPRVAVVATGSTWSGQLDERRLSVVASANRASTYVDGWAQANQFPSGNPWNASAVELTGAGATLEWREHGDHLGLDAVYLRPERTLQLQSVLPQGWLCTAVPQSGMVPETCAGGDWWASASASGGLRRGRLTLDAVGTIGDSHGVYSGYDSSGYVRGEVWFGTTRLILGGSGGHASFADWVAGEAGIGAALSRRVDAIVTYRPELLDYTASTGPMTLHSIVLDGHYALSPAFDIAASALGTLGTDRDAIALLATFVWRPLP